MRALIFWARMSQVNLYTWFVAICGHILFWPSFFVFANHLPEDASLTDAMQMAESTGFLLQFGLAWAASACLIFIPIFAMGVFIAAALKAIYQEKPDDSGFTGV